MRDAVGLEPLIGRDLVGTQDLADLVVEDFRRGARQGCEAGLFEPRQVVCRGSSSLRAPSVTSSAVNPWMWMRGEASRTALMTCR